MKATLELMLARHEGKTLEFKAHLASPAPHHLKALGPEQGIFIRVGSMNRQTDRYALDEMRRLAANRTFDEEPLPDLDSEAIDFRVASEFFSAILGLLADGQGHTTAEIARTIGRTPRATRSRLAGLAERGLVQEVGKGPRDPKVFSMIERSSR